MRGAALRSVIGCAAAGIVHSAPAALFVPVVRRTLAPRTSGLGDPGHVAMTFDDGPHPAATPAVLAVLARHAVRATFFVLGRELERHPRIGAAAVAQGHEIAVHGWDHRCLLRRGPSAVHDDLARTVDVIHRTTGRRPRYVRAPYGVFSTAALVSARRLGLTPVLWTCWGFDWTPRANPASVATTVLRRLGGGGTILLHDSDVVAAPGSWRATVGALPLILDRCGAQGLVVGPLREHRLRPGVSGPAGGGAVPEGSPGRAGSARRRR